MLNDCNIFYRFCGEGVEKATDYTLNNNVMTTKSLTLFKHNPLLTNRNLAMDSVLARTHTK
jgi:hypothetical protein